MVAVSVRIASMRSTFHLCCPASSERRRRIHLRIARRLINCAMINVRENLTMGLRSSNDRSFHAHTQNNKELSNTRSQFSTMLLLRGYGRWTGPQEVISRCASTWPSNFTPDTTFTYFWLPCQLTLSSIRGRRRLLMFSPSSVARISRIVTAQNHVR